MANDFDYSDEGFDDQDDYGQWDVEFGEEEAY